MGFFNNLFSRKIIKTGNDIYIDGYRTGWWPVDLWLNASRDIDATLYDGFPSNNSPNLTGVTAISGGNTLLKFNYQDGIITVTDQSRLFGKLEYITVDARGDGTLYIENNGGDKFMPTLDLIDVETDGNAFVNIDNNEPEDQQQQNPQDNLALAPPFLAGDVGTDFMASLDEIKVKSNLGEADLEISAAGTSHFMATLKSIDVEGYLDTSVGISASANTEGLQGEYFMPHLKTISVRSNQADADLSLSHSGGEYFMKSLETIDVYAQTRAEVSVSASANLDEPETDPDQFFGDTGANFMHSLQSIKITSRVDRATLSISHSGGDNFMKSLKTMDVRGQRAEISISASANEKGFDSNFENPETLLRGDNFMQSLLSIKVVGHGEGNESTFSGASLSVSHSGGDNFMQNLLVIDVHAKDGRAEISMSASANEKLFDSSTDEADVLLRGDNFMEKLQSIKVLQSGLGEDADRASLSLSHSGGDNFMKSLKTMHVESADGRAEISVSASANEKQYDDTTDMNTVLLRGDNYMQGLLGIKVISGGVDEFDRASLSLSHSGGDFFMKSLETIYVKSNGARADISISASANEKFYDDSANEYQELLRGDNFMESLKSINLISTADEATLSISHSGGDNFMKSLKTIYVNGMGDDGEVSISASANEKLWSYGQSNLDDAVLLEGNNFMQSLHSIVVLSGANDELSYQDRASLSISHSGGGDNFMQNLQTILVKNQEGRAEVSISGSANGKFYNDSTDEYAVQLRGDNFMQQLKTITVISEGAADTEFSSNARASISISHSGGDNFMQNLLALYVEGNDLDGRTDISISGSLGFEGAEGMNFMGNLRSINVINNVGEASLSISMEGHDSALRSVNDINVDGETGGEIQLQNGAGHDFMQGLAEISMDVARTANNDDGDYEAGDLDDARIVLENFARNDDLSASVPEGGIAGDRFLQNLQSIALTSGSMGDVVVVNGRLFDPWDDTPPVEIGGGDFMNALETVQVTTTLDGDVLMSVHQDGGLQMLTSIDVDANQGAGFPARHAQQLAELVNNGSDPSGLLDLATTSIILDGNGFAGNFAGLSTVDVDSNGIAAGADNDVGDIEINLTDVTSASFAIAAATNEWGEIDVDVTNTPGLTGITLSGDHLASVNMFGAQTSFATLDLTGMTAGSASTVDLSDGTAVFGTDIDVRIGQGDLAHTAANRSEDFIFTDATIGGVVIDGFDTGAPGGTGDELDLSALGVADTSELTFTDIGGNLEITSNDADFTGTITLNGVTAALVADNIIFA